MLSSIGRKAASVFPVPVGAMSRAFLPSATSGTILICGSVGVLNPLSSRAFSRGWEKSLWKTLSWSPLPARLASGVLDIGPAFPSLRGLPLAYWVASSETTQTAPLDEEVTSLAYFAKTPCVYLGGMG